jgi:hypothetical protein
MEKELTGWDSLPWVFKLAIVVRSWRERPNSRFLLLPVRLAAPCLAFNIGFKEKYGVSLGALSLLVLLPEKWTAALLLLVVLKTKHSLADLLRLIFWDCWFDPEHRVLSLRFKAVCAGIVGFSAGVCLAGCKTFVWLFRGHI